ncbi:MAG: alpha/beta hydrolase-fold protein [Vicinamibacteraceae bacterium]
MTMIADVGPASIVRGDAEPGARLTGRFDLLHDFGSPALGTARRVSIYLPPGYDGSSTRYPVLYLQDGQNLFDPGRAFVPGHDWGLDEAAEGLIQAGEIAPLILVGIDHGGVDRLDEYTPSCDPRTRAGGRLSAYRHFLVDELKPWIDARYRTRADAASTGLCGSSLGGLAALEIGLSRPDVFGRLAALSPSLWWDRRCVLGRARALDGRLEVAIWLDAGTHEGPGVVHHVRMLKNILLGHGWRLKRDLHYREIAGGQHSEADWARRAPDVLRTLFPPEG